MSTLSTACFVHKKASKSKNRSSRSTPKKASRQEKDLSNKRTERLKRFSTLWEEVLQAIQNVQSTVYTEILEDCVRYVEKAKDKLAEHGNCDGEIPTAVLITGVNMPDHDIAFATLQEMIRISVSPLVVSLSSNNDADTVKTAVQKLVSTLVSMSQEDKGTMKKMKYTMPNLVSWYRDVGISSSPLKTSRLAKRDQSVPSPSKRRKVSKSKKPIVIIFEDFERMLPHVARDFILICSEYSTELPFIFVFGVATSTTVVHKVVSQSSMSKLAMETFRSRRSSDFLNIIVNEVLLNTRFPFKVSNRLFKLFEDIFLFNDLSVKTFVNGLKSCLMYYFYENPVSDLCCDPRDLKQQIESLDGDTLDELRKLKSFRTYVDPLPLKEQKALLLDDKYLKETARSKLDDLNEYHECFYPVLRFLHALCKDLPKNLLGKQLRESYSLCLETDVGSSKEFIECSKMLRMMARDELLNIVKNAADSARTASSSCPSVIISLNTELEPIVTKLEELKGNTSEKVVVQQDLKEVAKKRKSPNAYELLREELIVVIESYVIKYLKNYRSFVFHEVVYFNVSKSAKGELLGHHRESLQTALENPGHYLKCKCCSSSKDQYSVKTRPDVCVAYKLHTEYSRLINLSDWMQSFNTVICPSESDSEDEGADCKINKEIIARFFHSVAELQFLGFVKPASQGKTDHVIRHAW